MRSPDSMNNRFNRTLLPPISLHNSTVYVDTEDTSDDGDLHLPSSLDTTDGAYEGPDVEHHQEEEIEHDPMNIDGDDIERAEMDDDVDMDNSQGDDEGEEESSASSSSSSSEDEDSSDDDETHDVASDDHKAKDYGSQPKDKIADHNEPIHADTSTHQPLSYGLPFELLSHQRMVVKVMQASDLLNMSMSANTQAGSSATLTVTATRSTLRVQKDDFVTLTLPVNSFRITRSTCVFYANTISSATRFGSAYAAYDTTVTVKSTMDIASGSTIIIQCPGSTAALYEIQPNTPIPGPVDLYSQTTGTIRYQQFVSSYLITAGHLGTENFPSMIVTPESKLLFRFQVPYDIPANNHFVIALDPIWHKTNAPNCRFYQIEGELHDQLKGDGTHSNAQIQLESSGTREMMILSMNIVQQVNKGEYAGFWCEGFTIPKSTNNVAYGAAKIVSTSQGLTLARSDAVHLPVLKDEVGGDLFNIQLDQWTAGTISKMDITLKRFPVEIVKGDRIEFTLPNQYEFIEDTTNSCGIYQETEYQQSQMDYEEISSTYSIVNNILTFILIDQPIWNTDAITQFRCTGVLPLASHKALNNITIRVFITKGNSPTTPAYTRTDGIMSEVYPANLGSISRQSTQSNTRAGALSNVIIDVKPSNTGIRRHDVIQMRFDNGYRLHTNHTHCALYVSNDKTNLISTTNGDKNVSIVIQNVNGRRNSTDTGSPSNGNNDNDDDGATQDDEGDLSQYELHIKETADVKLALLGRSDTSLRIECDGVRNPPREYVDRPTVGMYIFNPNFGSGNVKARFSASILSPITPNILGQNTRLYQPVSTQINSSGPLTIIVNSLSNPVPSTSDGGSIRFHLPSTWTVNSNGVTNCECNQPNCTGITTTDNALDQIIIFKPTTVVQSGPVIFTCSNVKTPNQPENSRANLRMVSMQGTAVIDETNTAQTPEIVRTGSSATNVKVVHTLVYNSARLFTQGEIAVLEMVYKDTLPTMSLHTRILKQTLETAYTFKVPNMFADSIDTVTPMALDLGGSSGSGSVSVGRRGSNVVYDEEYDNDDDNTDNHPSNDDDSSADTVTNEDNDSPIHIVTTTNLDEPSPSYPSHPNRHQLEVFSNKFRRMSTLEYDDIFHFTTDSRVVTVSTLVETSNTAYKQEDIIQALNVTLSRKAFSDRANALLSVRPIYQFSGLTNGSPLPAHCSNGVKDQNERDVDCGGSCPKCRNGFYCEEKEDCESNICKSGRCSESSAVHLTTTLATLLALAISGLVMTMVM